MKQLSEFDTEQLLEDARYIDRSHRVTALAPRIQRLVEEVREIRDQQSVRQFMSEQEQAW